MSRAPIKKSDEGKTWATQQRRDIFRLASPFYHLVITEGTKTERYYFEGLRRRLNACAKGHFRGRLEIWPEGRGPQSLLELAQREVARRLNPIQHIWLVYDKDDFTTEQFDGTELACRQLCRNEEGPHYHAIWSNQCIEYWFILHFQDLAADIDRQSYHDILTRHLQAAGCGGYSKTRDDMFDVLWPRIDEAIARAEKMAKERIGQLPSACAPGTNLHELLKEFMPYLRDAEKKT